MRGSRISPPNCAAATAGRREEDQLDGGVPVHEDYAACQITREEDWIDLYARPFYFGCEADDRMNAVVFGKVNPFGARINAILRLRRRPLRRARHAHGSARSP